MHRNINEIQDYGYLIASTVNIDPFC